MILFVYSDSSNWKDYIETNILPRIEAHSIILNWSKRREWGSRMRLETKLFNQWAGPGEFVPVADSVFAHGESKNLPIVATLPRIPNTEKAGYPGKPNRPSLTR